MPCTTCMAAYSLLRKEQACANCGYGFCSNCLRHSWSFPTLSKKPLSVCAQCYRQLSEAEQKIHEKTRNRGVNGNWWGDDVLPPPSMRGESHARVTNTNWRGGGGGGLKTDAQKPQHKRQTDTDALRVRLDKLKDETKPTISPMTTQELEERFAALREMPVDEVRHPGKMFLEGNGKEETAEELICRINEEMELEDKWNPDKRLQDRYDHLCGIEKPIVEQRDPVELADTKTLVSPSEPGREEFDIGNELAAVKKVLEKCDSAEKPTDPAKHNWKNDEYGMEQILKDVKKLQEKDKKINRAISPEFSDESELDDDEASLNEDVQKILKEAELAEEEACKLVRVSQAERPPPPDDPAQNTSPLKKSGFFSRFFKK